MFLQSKAHLSVGDASIELLHCAGCHGDGGSVRAVLFCPFDMLLVYLLVSLHGQLAQSDQEQHVR